MASSIKYLTQEESIAIDVDLMSPTLVFSNPVLMELAGISVAESLASLFAAPARVLVIVGPGNNGGDALVCARHLKLWGYRPRISYPKRSSNPELVNLVTQAVQFHIPFEETFPSNEHITANFDVIVDGIFGAGFKGDIRAPFDSIIAALTKVTVPIVSVDIPSGWHVEQGDLKKNGIKPYALVSLSAPKLCAKFFEGQYHFLGGRFIPPALAEKFALNLPAYEGSKQSILLTKH